jgi:phosphate acetyltransferase
MEILSRFKEIARKKNQIIVFPDGEHPAIIEAACRLQLEKIARPILLGIKAEIQKIMLTIKVSDIDLTCIDPSSDKRLDTYCSEYAQERSIPERVARRMLTQPLYFAAMMVKKGDASGMVGGINCPTRDVLLASELIIGFAPGMSVASSFYLMDIPGYSGGENGLLLFADPAIQPNPDSNQLADIAIATASSAKKLLGWEPRIAMLSFSTKGSAEHPLAEKVAKALSIVQERAPDLLIDGEMQLDAALVESVAKQKIKTESPVAGRANILIFPNLDAANIGAKLVQQLAKARSYGPILQGFAAPVSDLSRSATSQDVFNSTTFIASM